MNINISEWAKENLFIHNHMNFMYVCMFEQYTYVILFSTSYTYYYSSEMSD